MSRPLLTWARSTQGGAVAVLLMIFMAVTSAFSSDLVCIASVITYDVYRSYVNPKATGKQLLRLSHIVVVLFALFCASIAAGLSQTAIGVNFIVVSRFLPFMLDFSYAHIMSDVDRNHLRPGCLSNCVDGAVEEAKHDRRGSGPNTWHCYWALVLARIY